MSLLSTTIGDNLPVIVEYIMTGDDMPATLVDPAEYKEVIIESVTSCWCEIMDCLKDSVLSELRIKCREDYNNE